MVKKAFGREMIMQFSKFCLVGLESAVVYYLIFLFFFFFLKYNYLLATGIGFTSGGLIGYYFNKVISFESHRKNIIALPIYLGVYFFTLILTIFTMKFLVDLLNINPLVSILLVICLTVPINFFGIKIFAFQNKKW